MSKNGPANGAGIPETGGPKLNIPRPRPNRIRRPNLLTRLCAVSERSLTLLSAPAGFGKTTLLAEWAQLASRHYNIAWLSLDPEDNDPARFMLSVKRSLYRLNKEWQGALESFDPIGGLSPSASVMSLLSPIENAAPARSVLIFDDYHCITNTWIHSALDFLIEHLPPRLHVVISTRADPPLPLARLRARDQLVEIRTSDLALTADEAALFFKRVMNLDLSPADNQILHQRTEGWLAGLQLVALALQAQPSERAPADVSNAISRLTGNHPLVADYLAQEVLARQKPAVQAFLLKTSLLDRLTSPLCNALLQTDNSQAILDYLERANVFLVPLDDERRWYRYHGLFAEWLRRQLEHTQPNDIADLHRRAALWFLQQDHVPEAIRHLVSAGDFGAAADQVEPQVQSMLKQGQASTVLTWLDALPHEVIWSRLPLCLAYGAALNATRQVQRTAPYIQRAQALLQNHSRRPRGKSDKEPRGQRIQLALIRAGTAMWQGNFRAMVKHSKTALALDPPPAAQVAIGTNLVYGCTMAGDMPSARQAVALVEKTTRRARNPQLQILALNSRAMIQTCCGELHDAARGCRRALYIADTELKGTQVSYSLVLLGEILREWNELAQAQKCLTEATERDRRAGRLGSHAAHLHLGRILAAQGKFGEALEQFDHAEEIMLNRHADKWETQAAAFRARVRIMQGQIDEANRWAEQCGLDLQSPRIGSPIPGYLPEIEYLTLVRLGLAEHYELRRTPLAVAENWLRELERNAERCERYGSLIEILVLQSLLFETQDKEHKSRAALTRALTIGEPEKYVRVFVDEGAPMLALLGRERECDHHSYVRRLIAQFPTDASRDEASLSTPADLLTSHELRVLRLIARGLSNQAIADELHVSLNTIRTHTQHLFQKLDVHNRTAAVDVARRQGWL